MSTKAIPVKERLFNKRKIDEITGCWLWPTIGHDGYGAITINGKAYRVHRISYEIFIGPLKKLCLHKPNCPNKNCFNPDHLYDGNHSKNAADALKTGARSIKTHCKNGHEYNLQNTGIDSFSGGRYCVICRKLNKQNKNKGV